ncbi:MAG TPA: hypothetical protein PK007_01130 [Candidatus Kapabacteria bacterium]|nr:hypothetical protein [Candidatus Kapabacteria bacterium]
METKKIKTETTKMGYHALWEAGGGATNTGEATIIASSDGKRKKPIYVKRAGHLANAQHALIVVEPEDIIIKSYHKRKDFWTRVFRIKSFDGEFAIAELIYEFRDGKWNFYPPAYLQPAITACIEKATCYHCREPYYILE